MALSRIAWGALLLLVASAAALVVVLLKLREVAPAPTMMAAGEPAAAPNEMPQEDAEPAGGDEKEDE